MKIIVIEDESSALNGIIRMIKSINSSYEVVASASNGHEGLEQIFRYAPDVVVTDIAMPGINGVDMIEKANQAGVCCEYILLSGHNSFAYAQKAISVGVCEYLLKPFSRSALEHALEKAELRVSQKDTSVHAEPFYMTSRERALYRQIMGYADAQPQTCIADFILFCTHIPSDAALAESIRHSFLLNHFHDIMELQLMPSGDPCCVLCMVSHYPNAILGSHKKYAENIAASVLRDCPSLGMVVLKSVEPNCSLATVHQALLESGKWRIQVPRKGESHIHWEEALARTKVAPIAPFVQLANNLDGMLRLGDYSGVLASFDEMQRLLAENYYHCDQLRQALLLVLASIDAFTRDNQAEGFMEKWEQRISSYGFASDVLDGLRAEVVALQKGASVPARHPLVARIFEISQQNYAQPLNLELLAQQMNVSSKYLGKVFIEETGIKFSQYLNQLRIQKAQSLLSQTSMNVAHIANLVGYADEKYFQRVFKELVGVSPGSYARIHKRH